MHACKELYADWKYNKPGWENVNPNGFDLDVSLIFTLYPVNSIRLSFGSLWSAEREIYHHSWIEFHILVLQVPYVHSGLDRDRRGGPTIVAIHGSPGTHRDFDALIPAVDHMGANVIVPTFPGE